MEDLMLEAEQTLFIRVYGKHSWSLEEDTTGLTGRLGHSDGRAHIIKVSAIGYNILGQNHCYEVTPFYLMVTGDGKIASKCGGNDLPEGTKYWNINRNATSIRLDSSIGLIEELLEQSYDPDTSRRGPLDIKGGGDFSATVIERGNGNICIRWRAGVWGKYRFLGSKWRNFLSTTISGENCIADNACITVADADILRVQLCYEPNNNRICANARIGFRGAYAKFTVGCISL